MSVQRLRVAVRVPVPGTRRGGADRTRGAGPEERLDAGPESAGRGGCRGASRREVRAELGSGRGRGSEPRRSGRGGRSLSP